MGASMGVLLKDLPSGGLSAAPAAAGGPPRAGRRGRAAVPRRGSEFMIRCARVSNRMAAAAWGALFCLAAGASMAQDGAMDEGAADGSASTNAATPARPSPFLGLPSFARPTTPASPTRPAPSTPEARPSPGTTPETAPAAPSARIPQLSRPASRRTGPSGPAAQYFPRSEDEIRQALKVIEDRRAAEYPGLTRNPGGKGYPQEYVEALNRLNAYRYIAGLSSDVTLDPGYTELAEAAAGICQKLGRLDHNPPNPGMPPAEYKKAAEGAGRSNLHSGGGVVSSVDGFMFDSDPSNIDRLGHRRWCLNPPMAKTGFGAAGGFAAMYSMDHSGTAKEFDYVAFPAAGFMPSRYFGPRHAWCVLLNPKKYRPPARDKLTINLYPLKGPAVSDPASRKDPLRLDYVNVDTGGYGIPICVMFRPAEIDLSAGERYWVSIDGLAGGKGRIEYAVEFTK